MKLSIYVSPVPDPMVWEEIIFQLPWDDRHIQFSSLGLVKGNTLKEPLGDLGRSIVATGKVVPRPNGSSGGRNS